MPHQKPPLNPKVTSFLDDLKHPLRTEIEHLRQVILRAKPGLSENIKWNGPNYCFNTEDRITMKIQPPKLIQIIFHRGAKVKAQPERKLIQDNSGLLTWKENDRALAAFKNLDEIEKKELVLSQIIEDWIDATS